MQNKILMLGWEFPPLFSGGLGVATYGIVKALSGKNEITLIVPQSEPSDKIQARVIGLNRLAAEEINVEKLSFGLSDQVSLHSVPMALSPYHFENLSLSAEDETWVGLLSGKKKLGDIRAAFSGTDPYGAYIIGKVNLYAQLADQISSTAKFDVIHAHDWVTFPAGLKIKKRTNKPLVLHVHALETDRAGENTRNDIFELERKAMIASDRIIAVSEYTRGNIVKHYGIDAEKIDVVHNAIEPSSPSRKQHQLKDKFVVFLGRITHQKGPEFLLETAEKVVRVYPRVKFVVAGTGDQFAHLLESSAYKKLGRKFIFTGYLARNKVNELLSMADAYFMPSVSEPFGISALEAAQHHVPGVISFQSGAGEVLKSFLKADFWDTDKYANYIHALLRYSALGKEMTNSASGELSGHTWEKAAAKIMGVYEKVKTKRIKTVVTT